MTLGELSQLKHLKREIAMDRQRLRQLEEAAGCGGCRNKAGKEA